MDLFYCGLRIGLIALRLGVKAHYLAKVMGFAERYSFAEMYGVLLNSV